MDDLLPALLQLPQSANATMNAAPWFGFINPEQITAFQNVGGGNALATIGTLQITIPIAWIQSNWPALFYDRVAH